MTAFDIRQIGLMYAQLTICQIQIRHELRLLANMGTNTFRTEFIDLYREQVCLWDVKSNEYANKHKLFPLFSFS